MGVQRPKYKEVEFPFVAQYLLTSAAHSPAKHSVPSLSPDLLNLWYLPTGFSVNTLGHAFSWICFICNNYSAVALDCHGVVDAYMVLRTPMWLSWNSEGIPLVILSGCITSHVASDFITMCFSLFKSACGLIVDGNSSTFFDGSNHAELVGFTLNVAYSSIHQLPDLLAPFLITTPFLYFNPF